MKVHIFTLGVRGFKHYDYHYNYTLQQEKGREKEEPLRCRGREK